MQPTEGADSNEQSKNNVLKITAFVIKCQHLTYLLQVKDNMLVCKLKIHRQEDAAGNSVAQIKEKKAGKSQQISIYPRIKKKQKNRILTFYCLGFVSKLEGLHQVLHS